MKKLKIIFFTAFTLLSTVSLFAQQAQFYQFTLKNETEIRGSKLYYKGLTSKGSESSVDINEVTKTCYNRLFKTYSSIDARKIGNQNAWTKNPRFEEVEDEKSADVVIGGTYHIITGEKVQEILFYESGSYTGGSIPYYEVRQSNEAQLQLVISYTFKNKKVEYDTIMSVKESERKPGKKIKTTDDLLLDCVSEIKTNLNNTFQLFNNEPIWYKFLSVKTSDKAFKEELKNVKSQLESGNIKGMGQLYKSIYEADKSNTDAAFNVGMCYELLGNYPKALEYYAIMPDFHTKVRMKQNMELFDYLNEIGAKLIIEDF